MFAQHPILLFWTREGAGGLERPWTKIKKSHKPNSEIINFEGPGRGPKAPRDANHRYEKGARYRHFLGPREAPTAPRELKHQEITLSR